jgi:hypothetical protein
MSKARNGNKKCPNCRHFVAAHSYRPGTNRRPCQVPACLCVSLEKTEPPFKKGDKVISDYYTDEALVVRKVTHVERRLDCQSGYLMSADGGEPCCQCDRPLGQPIASVDSAYFKPAKTEKRK